MRNRSILLSVTAIACASGGGNSTPTLDAGTPSTLQGVSDRAMRIYRESYVVDAHNDMPSKMADDGYNADVRHRPGFGKQEGHTDLPRLMESGITGQFFSAFVDAPYALTSPDSSLERALQLADTIHAFAARHPDKLIFATTAADVRRAKESGKVAVLIGVEGGHAIENSLENLRELHRRGVRYMTLTWNNGNQWSGAAWGVNGTSTGGLTAFGRDVIREMNRLGILVDISHVSDSTFFDAIAASSQPVIASHSSARALHEHRRNMNDEQLRAVAKNGGVVNVNFYSAFIDTKFDAAVTAMEARLTSERESLRMKYAGDSNRVEAELRTLRTSASEALPGTPLSILVDHIDHIAKVAGVAHVGLGSDFDGVSALPEGMEDVTRLPRIAQALLDRGYSEDDVKKVLGGNMMRVMGQVLDRREAPDR
ncbi:MAG: membrane dipeptidase [Anaerolineae bacterium]|nr:membrane dipeptidase [Gemmatimonadaceae bacterium]